MSPAPTASPAPRARRSRLAGVSLLLLTLFVLTGCVKLNSDLDVSKDLTLSGTMSVMMKKSAIEDLGQTTDEALEEMTREMPDMSDRGVTTGEVHDELYVGIQFTLDDVDPTQFTEDELGFISQLSLSEQDGTISLSMPNPVAMPSMDMPAPPTGGYPGAAPGIDTGLGVDSIRSMLDESIMTFTFPGKVIEAPGAEVNGSTASWDLQTFEGEELTAEAQASGFPWWILIVIGIIVLLGIVALVIVLVLMSRKKKRQQQGAGLGAPGAQYGAPGGQGYPGGPAAAAGPYGSGPQPGQYGSGPQAGQYGSGPQAVQYGGAQHGQHPGQYGSGPAPGQYGSGPQAGAYGSGPQPGQQQPGPYGSGPAPGPYGSGPVPAGYGGPAGSPPAQPGSGHPGGPPQGGPQMPGQPTPGQNHPGQGHPGQGHPGQGHPGQNPQDRFRPPRH